jgi:hypothetical protein
MSFSIERDEATSPGLHLASATGGSFTQAGTVAVRERRDRVRPCLEGVAVKRSLRVGVPGVCSGVSDWTNSARSHLHSPLPAGEWVNRIGRMAGDAMGNTHLPTMWYNFSQEHRWLIRMGSE